MTRISMASFVLPVGLFLTIGCKRESINPTRGQFIYENGQPVTGLEGFSVEFKGATQNGMEYRATNAQGLFDTTIVKPGGLPSGIYTLTIKPKMIDSEREAPYRKYRSFDTSELTAEVKEGANDFKFTVEPKKKVTGGGK